MQYATSLRVHPLTRNAVSNGGITLHNSRKGSLQENIDPRRVPLNKVLIGTADPAQDLKDATKGVKMARAAKNREQDFVGAELVLTAHHQFFEGMPKDKFQRWVNKNVEFLKARFDGQNNRGKLVNAILHMDELAPHIHAIVAPVVEKSRVNPVTKQPMPAVAKLNYSEIFMDRKDVLWEAKKAGRSHIDTKLGRLQTAYADEMKEFGLIRGRESAATYDKKLRHVTPKEYQAGKAKAEKELNTVKAEIQQLNNSKKAITASVQELNSIKKDADNSLKEVNTTLKNGVNAISTLKSNHSRLQNEFKAAESKWHGEIARLEGLAAQGKEAVQSAKAEAEKARAEAEQAKAEAEAAKAALNAKTAELANFEQNHSEKLNEITTLQAEAKTFRDYRNEMMSQVADMEKKQNRLAPNSGVNLFKHIVGVLNYAKVQDAKTYAQYYIASIPRPEAVAIIHHAAESHQNWEKDAMYKQYNEACEVLHNIRVEHEKKQIEAEKQAEREARRSSSHSRGMSR